MPTIKTDLDTLGNGLKVVVELYKSLFSFIRAQLHEQGNIGLYVKRSDIERAICCCRNFNNEKRIGSLDKMAALVQYDTINIQMSSLVDNCVALMGTLITSFLVISTESYVSQAFIHASTIFLL